MLQHIRTLPTISSSQQSRDGPLLFQHNCRPVHNSMSTQTWIRVCGEGELDWPAPELNPLQHLWDEVELRLQVRLSYQRVSDLTNVHLVKNSHKHTPQPCCLVVQAVIAEKVICVWRRTRHTCEGR